MVPLQALVNGHYCQCTSIDGCMMMQFPWSERQPCVVSRSQFNRPCHQRRLEFWSTRRGPQLILHNPELRCGSTIERMDAGASAITAGARILLVATSIVDLVVHGALAKCLLY